MINVNDYEDFVLNGGNLSDLFQDIEERAREGFTTIEDVVAIWTGYRTGGFN